MTTSPAVRRAAVQINDRFFMVPSPGAFGENFDSASRQRNHADVDLLPDFRMEVWNLKLSEGVQ